MTPKVVIPRTPEDVTSLVGAVALAMVRVRDALVSRSDNALSHLRLGRRRT
jgi:hypothetical protein